MVIVPARFKSGTLYSEIPTSGAGDFTVTRASGGVTRVNASGLIESAKTNLVLRSEEFDNASWSKTGLTASTGTTTEFIAPDGNLTAQALTLTLVSGGHTCNQFLRWPSGTLAVGSVYVKPNTATKFFIANGSLGVGVFFNLSNGTIEGTIGAMSGTISAVGNGYYRITAAHTATASQTFQLGIYQTFVSGDYTSTAQFTPSSANLLYVWGAQLEEGSSASEYIPTTTVARTRFAGVTVDGTSPSGIPRLDYFASGGTVGCPALLVEPSGQNLARQSEDFTTTWNAVNTTPTPNQTTSPDNTLTADRISITSNGGYIRQLLATSNSTTYTASCFVKNDAVASGDTFRFYFNNNLGAPNAAVANATININAGTVSTGSSGSGISSVSTGIENYGNGWYRVRITFTLGASAGNASSEIGFETLTATRTFFAWGAQLETGSVATSYIPTTTAAVTRNADVISLSGAVSGCIGRTEGTIYAEVDYRNFANITILSVQTASIVSGAVRIENTSNGTQSRCHVRGASGETVMDQTITSPSLSTGINKIAVGYSSAASGLCIALNGTVVFTGTAAAAFTINADRILLGSREVSGAAQQFFNNRIRSVALYTTRLTNAELAALTTL
ncbi:hypothetical protein EBZ39_15615 [bacterium]|nr:hypothetical protein [bacterium]